MKVTVTQVEAGQWRSSVEVELGGTANIIFEISKQSYPSEAEARHAVLALALQNLSRSRIAQP